MKRFTLKGPRKETPFKDLPSRRPRKEIYIEGIPIKEILFEESP